MRGKSRNSQARRLGVEPRKTGRDHPCPSCPIRVLTAHGHDLVRLGVGAMPEEEKDIVVVGESRRRASAISQVPRVKPDVVLIQPHSPGESDDTRSHLLRDADSGIRLVVIAMPCTSSRFNRVADRGACGHEIEEMSRLELLRVILNSRLKCNTCGPRKDFGWGPIGEAFPGSIIQFLHDRRKSVCRDRGEIRLFREIIA